MGRIIGGYIKEFMSNDCTVVGAWSQPWSTEARLYVIHLRDQSGDNSISRNCDATVTMVVQPRAFSNLVPSSEKKKICIASIIENNW